MNQELTTRSAMTDGPNGMAIATSRQAQEVQGAIIMAKNFPRDETKSLERIMRACKRTKLAESAMYAYPRGNETVTGPSIRLAEAVAGAWGNIDFGIIELEQSNNESAMMAYAWDLETNVRRQMVFQVPHKRFTKHGVKHLTDSRDIYELVANQGARRVRACILAVIPGDIVDTAVEQCTKTLQGANERPLKDRVRDMVLAFGEMGVTKEMLEKRLGHSLDICIEQEFVNLRKIFTGMRDGMSTREQWFEVPSNSEESKQQDSSTAIKDKMKAKEAEQGTQPTEDPPESKPEDATGEEAQQEEDTEQPSVSDEATAGPDQESFQQQPGESVKDFHVRLTKAIAKATPEELTWIMNVVEDAFAAKVLTKVRHTDLSDRMHKRSEELS